MIRSFDALHIDSFASGAWPLLSWVSGGTREPCPQFGLTLGEFSLIFSSHVQFAGLPTAGIHHQLRLCAKSLPLSSRATNCLPTPSRESAGNLTRGSCRQFFVGEMLSNHSTYERVEP